MCFIGIAAGTPSYKACCGLTSIFFLFDLVGEALRVVVPSVLSFMLESGKSVAVAAGRLLNRMCLRACKSMRFCYMSTWPCRDLEPPLRVTS